LGSKDWLLDLTLLSGLKKMASDVDFQKKWMDIKHANKLRLAGLILEKCGLKISPDALFDIQVEFLFLTISLVQATSRVQETVYEYSVCHSQIQ
jgi:hypothetical protein